MVGCKRSLMTRIDHTRRESSSEPSFRVRRGRFVTMFGQEFNLKHPLGAVAYVWMTLHSRYPAGKQLWEVLANTYGEERVISALAAHPIPVPIEYPWQVPSVAEYCRLWLYKYAPDMAVTTAATGSLLATTVFIPVLFLRGSLIAAFGPTAEVSRWTWLWLVVTLLLLYLIVTSQRAHRATFQLFYRFVTVQLIEHSRVASGEQIQSASGNAALEGSMQSPAPKDKTSKA